MTPRAIAATLPKVTKPVLEKRGRAYAALIAEWSGMVGPHLAEVSLPERLTWPHSAETGGTLLVRVSGAAATDFQHLAPQIMERINIFLGFTAVARLKLVQGPLPGRARVARRRPRPLTAAEAQAIAASVKAVPDEAVKAALERFGQSIAAEAKTPILRSGVDR